MADEARRLRWQRYGVGTRSGSANGRSLARFTLDDHVVISGAAPDSDVNRLICDRFNAVESDVIVAAEKHKGHWSTFSCLKCGEAVTQVRDSWTRQDGITVIRTRLCRCGHRFTTEERPSGRNNGSRK